MAPRRVDAPWLMAPFVKKVVAALGQGTIRFVGGAVRDTLMGRRIGDIDAATSHVPADTLSRLENAGIRAVPTGLGHGTVTAVSDDGLHIEITTLRHDVRTDGRHAEVAFTDDWTADAARRDFTMNALYLAPDGTLFDPVSGYGDLQAGRVRFIGDAATRIREDALRILRFFRFHAHYGAGAPDREGLQACAAEASLIDALSAERVRDEMLKLLGAPDPVATWQAMADAGVAAHLPGAPFDLAGLDRLVVRERDTGQVPDVLLRLVAVAALEPASVRAPAKALRLSGNDTQALAAYAQGRTDALALDGAGLRAYLYRHGRLAAKACLMVAPAAPPAATLACAAEWNIPQLPVRGADLLALGLRPGPRVSTILQALDEDWIASDFRLDRSALLEKAEALLS
ncbi:MAG: CCA tRNA nucleotidyltransferase [Alphaproteobacteria bacterium]|nr:MAG: CCA tRNA nucleotidyltransferase [Alphaproteobacteria bacterium]